MKKLAPWLLVSLIYTFAIPQYSMSAAFSNPEQVLAFPIDQELIAQYEALDERRARFRTVVITGYSSTVDQTDSTPFITASNKRVRPGIVAANFLPFGTQIKVPKYFGDRVFIVEDRMNKRFNNRVDIWFTSRGEALRFGKVLTTIEILE